MGKGFLIYMIGMSGSGKTTLAEAVERKMRQLDEMPVQMIDGDVLRAQFGGIFGYTYEERKRYGQVVNVVVKYLLDNGINVILTQVAAYQSIRDEKREQFNGRYVEVYVKCSTAECIKRDTKGYYAAKIENLNGLTAPYETPKNSEIVIDTEIMSVEEEANAVVAYLEKEGYIL